MSRNQENQSQNFDPNAAAAEGSGIFGLPFQESAAQLVLLPVPWDATTSYGGGTSAGPQAILEASAQQDLYDLELGRPYEPGIFFRPIDPQIEQMNTETRALALEVMEELSEDPESATARAKQERVNERSAQLNAWVYRQASELLDRGKVIGVVGGDHSTPFGAIQAIAERHDGISILHFDAHSDTRRAYSGFHFSHASIMHNVLTRIPKVKKLVQVGIRDFCEEEMEFMKSQGHRARIFFDADLQRRKLEGESFRTIAQEIISSLSPEVYISFDIDGLDPKLCPSTGTPVPGGLEFAEAVMVIRELVKSGRKIVGFDLNEVAPSAVEGDEWDANVGMRLLYKLCGWTFASLGLLKARP